MPSTVSSLFGAANVVARGCVRWGERVPINAPGIYVVATTSDADALGPTFASAPTDRDALVNLLSIRSEMSVDDERPSVDALAARLDSFWLADELALYVGLAGTSLRSRVGLYYKTALGADKPHAGGWWLKTLNCLDDLFVHFALTDDPGASELSALESFEQRCSAVSRAALPGNDLVLPFANLEREKGNRKPHGIRRATGPVK